MDNKKYYKYIRLEFIFRIKYSIRISYLIPFWGILKLVLGGAQLSGFRAPALRAGPRYFILGLIFFVRASILHNTQFEMGSMIIS